jgi:hypothetical protein
MWCATFAWLQLMSSSGYTPLFGSLTTGTLCGRWPDIGLWPIVLSLADRHGVVDVTPDYLARITGLQVDAVTACMARFCEPDPYSRSTAESGARLVLLDPEARQWGWRVVNHGKYREKARKAAFDADRTASGRDAERKRTERGASRDVPTRPDGTRADPPSDSDSDKTKNSLVLEDSDSRPPARPAHTQSTYESKEFHDQVIVAYHETLPDLPAVKVWSKKRAQALVARIRERLKDRKPADTIDYWRKLFSEVAGSDFLCGRSGEWRADLEWLLRPENFAKVIEGRYAPRAASNGNAAHGR